MSSFRFEYYENVITKHNIKNAHWTQVAKYAFLNQLHNSDVTVAAVRQIDEDTIEIIKRKDFNKSFLFKMGFDQRGIFERVTINRKDQSTAIDRMDINWWIAEPFIGRRDLFYPDPKYEGKQLAFVRHNFWLHKFLKFEVQALSNFSAFSYKRAIRSQEKVY